jgi:F0F1-type ATP synthase beta subunit
MEVIIDARGLITFVASRRPESGFITKNPIGSLKYLNANAVVLQKKLAYLSIYFSIDPTKSACMNLQFLTVNSYSFVKSNKMRRGIKPDPKSRFH